MLRHLVDVTLRHYDPEMRTLAALALGEIVRIGSPDVLVACVDSQASGLCCLDPPPAC